MSYKLTYKSRGNFLSWCEHWTRCGYSVYHTSWKEYYPKFKHVERNSTELIDKHSYNKYMHRDKEFYAIDKDGTHCFFDKKTLNKGEWKAHFGNDIDDLFD